MDRVLTAIGGLTEQVFAAGQTGHLACKGDDVTALDVNDDVKTRIAWLYYVEGMTQDEVANLVGMNRSRVLRILAAARQDGTVQIRVTTRMSRCVELERRLERLGQ